MKEEGCPFKDSCVVAGSLHSLNIPSITGYCRNNYRQCRYYRKRIFENREEQVEVGV